MDIFFFKFSECFNPKSNIEYSNETPILAQLFYYRENLKNFIQFKTITDIS